MNNDVIRNCLKSLKSISSTCENGNSCINLILNTRRLFFSFPLEKHIEFIDIAEEEYGIIFDDDSCINAIKNCSHRNDFNVLIDVSFYNGFIPKGE